MRALRVDERQHREAEAARELEHADRLAVALGPGAAEVAVGALLEVAALLVADERDRAAAEAAEAGDDRRILAADAVAVQLGEVVEQALGVVERVRALVVARELDRIPDVRLGRALGDAPAQPAELGSHASYDDEPPFVEAGPCGRRRTRCSTRPSTPAGSSSGSSATA